MVVLPLTGGAYLWATAAWDAWVGAHRDATEAAAKASSAAGAERSAVRALDVREPAAPARTTGLQAAPVLGEPYTQDAGRFAAQSYAAVPDAAAQPAREPVALPAEPLPPGVRLRAEQVAAELATQAVRLVQPRR